jgi:hypothetical protein
VLNLLRQFVMHNQPLLGPCDSEEEDLFPRYNAKLLNELRGVEPYIDIQSDPVGGNAPRG